MNLTHLIDQKKKNHQIAQSSQKQIDQHTKKNYNKYPNKAFSAKQAIVSPSLAHHLKIFQRVNII